jgi:hypothetical protein
MTFTGLIDDTLSQVRSFVRDQELSTWLKFGISAGATEATVNDAKVVSRGRIEIGSELLIVESVDLDLNKITFPPFGRGSDGTTPSAHIAGKEVTVQPLFPRKVVADTLNQVINAVSHKLFGIRVVTLTASPTRVSYQLPSDTTNVLSVQFVRDPSFTQDVQYAREWTFDQQAEWPTGKGILIYDYQTPGQPITVTTAVDPVPLVEGDDWSDSLLPDSAWDVVMLGAVARMLSTAGSYLAATRSVGSQTTLAAQMDPQTPMQISRYFYGQHQERLEQEATKLLSRYANRIHYQRRR